MSEANLELEERNGAVILTLSGNYAILPPEQAHEVAETLARYAYAAKTGSEPRTKSMIAEQIRAKMVTRISHVIKNLSDRNKPPLYIASEVVNLILSEAL